jgi:hypothetical protein
VPGLTRGPSIGLQPGEIISPGYRASEVRVNEYLSPPVCEGARDTLQAEIATGTTASRVRGGPRVGRRPTVLLTLVCASRRPHARLSPSA